MCSIGGPPAWRRMGYASGRSGIQWGAETAGVFFPRDPSRGAAGRPAPPAITLHAVPLRLAATDTSACSRVGGRNGAAVHFHQHVIISFSGIFRFILLPRFLSH